MKTLKKEVKSGKAVVGIVDISVYETMKEAIAALKEDKALSLINRQSASDVMNVYRTAKTQTASPVAALNRMAKTNPDLQKAIEALIAKYSA